MSHEMNQLEQLSRRLERLERQNRWWKLVTLAGVLVVGVGLLAGAQPAKKPRVIEAEGFIMLDAKGVKRVEIGAEGFFLNNEDGKHRISIFAGKEGGTGIALFADDTYKKQISLGIQDRLNGHCGLNINDDKGTNRVLLATQQNKPKLELQDETGKPVFSQAQP